jgi:hypothetical protein
MKHLFKLATMLTATVVGLVAVLAPASPALAETPGPSKIWNIKGVQVQLSYPAQWLNAGGSWDFGNAHLVMQTDGNLVLYKKGTRTVKWASNTYRSGATQMKFQKDGNLVLYAPGNRAVWSSKTYNKCKGNGVIFRQPVLALQNDSNFVIYCEITAAGAGAQQFDAMWDTNTNGI